MESSNFWKKVVEATGKDFWIEKSIGGDYRLMLGDKPIIEDSACGDLNEDYDTAEGFFINYLLEYEVPEDKKTLRCGYWFLKEE